MSPIFESVIEAAWANGTAKIALAPSRTDGRSNAADNQNASGSGQAKRPATRSSPYAKRYRQDDRANNYDDWGAARWQGRVAVKRHMALRCRRLRASQRRLDSNSSRRSCGSSASGEDLRSPPIPDSQLSRQPEQPQLPWRRRARSRSARSPTRARRRSTH
jgi:hypothetical protein